MRLSPVNLTIESDDESNDLNAHGPILFRLIHDHCVL